MAIHYPVKILQFGEGNFLRAFVEYMVEELNIKTEFNGSVVVVKAVPFGDITALKAQNFQYTLVTRGLHEGKAVDTSRIINSVSNAVCAYKDYDRFMDYAKSDTLQFIVSNTTEAGIMFGKEDKYTDCPPKEYPSKLTKFLYERYKHFKGSPQKGLYILPCELIENNGEKLEQYVLQTVDNWKLPKEFKNWLTTSCAFCSTLVDRIVTGYPSRGEAEKIEKRIGYTDPLLDVCEPFALWVLEIKKELSNVFPLVEAGVPAVFTHDVKPYRERKVRILNGAHTATVLAGFLAGRDIVRECVLDTVICKYMQHCIFDEILPVLPEDKNAGKLFAKGVFERFGNPYINHKLMSIALNSVSKWKCRVLGSFKDYYAAFGKIPVYLTFSFAALLAFYMGSDINGHEAYEVQDDKEILDFFYANNAKYMTGQYSARRFVEIVAANTSLWGEDLNVYDGFSEAVTRSLTLILEKGAYEAIKTL